MVVDCPELLQAIVELFSNKPLAVANGSTPLDGAKGSEVTTGVEPAKGSEVTTGVEPAKGSEVTTGVEPAKGSSVVEAKGSTNVS